MNNLPNGITRQSRYNYQQRITEFSQRWISLPKYFTRRFSGHQETLTERHTELTANPPYRKPTKWLPTSKGISYRSCLLRWPQRCRARMDQCYPPRNFHREEVCQDPTECRITTWQNLQMQCTKQLSHSRSALPTWRVWTAKMLTC